MLAVPQSESDAFHSPTNLSGTAEMRSAAVACAETRRNGIMAKERIGFRRVAGRTSSVRFGSERILAACLWLVAAGSLPRIASTQSARRDPRPIQCSACDYAKRPTSHITRTNRWVITVSAEPANRDFVCICLVDTRRPFSDSGPFVVTNKVQPAGRITSTIQQPTTSRLAASFTPRATQSISPTREYLRLAGIYPDQQYKCTHPNRKRETSSHSSHQ